MWVAVTILFGGLDDSHNRCVHGASWLSSLRLPYLYIYGCIRYDSRKIGGLENRPARQEVLSDRLRLRCLGVDEPRSKRLGKLMQFR